MATSSDCAKKTPEQIKEAKRKLEKKKELEEQIENEHKQKARLNNILNLAARTKKK